MKRRRRTSEQARAEIIRVAAQQFAIKGLSGTRVSEITRLANVSMATLYSHFSSKDELFTVASLEPFIAFAQEMGDLWDESRIAGTNDRKITENYVLTLFDHLSENRDSIRAILLTADDPDAVESAKLARREFAAVLRRLEDIAILWLRIRGREMPDAGMRVRSTVSLVLAASIFGDWLYGAGERTVRSKAIPTIIDVVYKANST